MANINNLILNNMGNMGLLNCNADGEFLTCVEYELAEELLYGNKDNCGSEQLLVATPDVNLERVALYWYFKMNEGEIFDGYEDFYCPMSKIDVGDLIIITSKWRKEMGFWQRAMVPFLLSTIEDANYYDNRIVVDDWDNIVDYAFEKECYFIFDDYQDALSGDDCEEAADSFFTIVDSGQMNTWIMCDRSYRKCGVFPALSGPSEIA